MAGRPILYDYWRSSASYRVRIALNLLGRSYDTVPVNLMTGAHRDPDYLAQNPQGILPSLEVDGHCLTQSLAIIEYLNTTTEDATLLPSDPLGQHRVRQLSYAVAMEIHPVCNLSVAAHVVDLTGGGEADKRAWMQHFISRGLSALEALLAQGSSGAFSYGNVPTMADCCLIPQLYNAERWGVGYQAHANIARIADTAEKHDAFAAAHPDQIGPPEE
ncbi:maleylacetoacetate isomerase [Sulfitobacter mediterraneus]|uniref:maleylacetoacetate isomerase n=1 Tax=Sulfitobacter mediterraneus TaxID=83219 RepID=UPI0021A7D328|nr:maleylacetoacetate isomerase [Sulfitobacter mediterraneus]UWR13382.1 maleylacetoacetate isomerase [Sulfitobacter mediterraneus]